MLDPTESAIQRAVCDTLSKYAKPDTLWYAHKNEGQRSMRTGERFKAEGMLPGLTDMGIVLAGRIHYLELKKRGGTLSVAQHGFGAKALRAGAAWNVAYSVAEAVNILNGWDIFRTQVRA